MINDFTSTSNENDLKKIIKEKIRYVFSYENIYKNNNILENHD
jgi:hypothetical protein